MIALDARTGRERWRTSRVASRIAHATPIVVRRPREWLVSNAGDVVQVFDPATGRLLHTIEAVAKGGAVRR